MRRLVQNGLLLTLVAGLLLPHASEAKGSKARLKLTPVIFDFGYIPQGFKVANRYWVANTGTDTLVISGVKPQCGCTTAPLKKDHIAPKDSVPLDVVFDSKNITGRINKKVTIASNDAASDSIALYFTGQVDNNDNMVKVEPRIALFAEIDKHKEVIRLTNLSGSQFHARLAAPPPGFISCDFSADTLAPGGSISLSLIRGKGTPVGEYETSVTIWLDAPIPHPISIPIKGLGYME